MDKKGSKKPVAVVGATGHTGGFVVDELKRRGLRALLIGRDAQRLAITSAECGEDAAPPVRMDDSASLEAALFGAGAVINCAGPFSDTALPVIDAALSVGIA